MFANQRHEILRQRKSLEEIHNELTLTPDMNVKSLIILLLALVFQLVQVLPAVAAIESCAAAAACCDCCDPMDSCPCADNDEAPKKSAPLSSESGNSLKIPVAKASGTRVSVESAPGTRPPAAVAALPITGHPCGYTGVRQSVAFCSFVI
jgi:hypothetical protein